MFLLAVTHPETAHFKMSSLLSPAAVVSAFNKVINTSMTEKISLKLRVLPAYGRDVSVL